MTRSNSYFRSIAYLPLLGLAFTVGCASPTTREDVKLNNFFSTPEWLEKAPWSKKKDEMPEPYPNPAKLAATWSPDVFVRTGKTPTRGFGGRLFFFDERSKAVPVEGTLTVHGFEVGADGNDREIKPFKFTPEQFTRHFSQSDFGASYSIWIPWDAVGEHEKRISLVATFQSSEGKIIQGSPTTVVLPGTPRAEASPSPDAMYSQRYRTHRDAVVHHATRPSGLVTTTIHRHSAGDDGKQLVPGKTIQERLAAVKNVTTQAGTTPFIDVQNSSASPNANIAAKPRQVDPSIRPASAVMPNDTVPRRATMPAGGVPQRIGVRP
ncbi:MAG: hypothetical protein AAGJ83_00100 [Planctomycetota bacterium]